ncbi:hypothetical protein GGI06_002995 [Coemansia sp. S85]|nr:hypothetical protein GGI06_002995 [Coemansia sp. S85]
MADIPYETPVAADEPPTSGPNLCEHTCNGESAPVNASNMCQNHQVEEPSKIVGDAEGTESTEDNVNDTKHIEGATEGTVENVAEVAPEGAPEDANEGPASGPTEATQ